MHWRAVVWPYGDQSQTAPRSRAVHATTTMLLIDLVSQVTHREQTHALARAGCSPPASLHAEGDEFAAQITRGHEGDRRRVLLAPTPIMTYKHKGLWSPTSGRRVMNHSLPGDVGAPSLPTSHLPHEALMNSNDTVSLEHAGHVATGYLHQVYAEALAEGCRVVALPRSGAHLIERPTPAAGHLDLTWAYPILSCQDWAGLEADIADLGTDYVTVSAIADPFGDYDEQLLRSAFPDVCRVFKHHFVTDLSQSTDSFVAGHHRRNVKKARRAVDVERADDVARYLETWTELYDKLIARHTISGVQRFSPASFRTQFEVPGLEVFVARSDGEIVGMLLWFVQGSVAYYHLGAYAPQGYELRASFALFDAVIEEFRSRGLESLSLGAGAGVDADADDGLTRFKRGWSTGTRPAYFLGRVLDGATFNHLAAASPQTAHGYFPPYRYGEYS